MFVGSLEFPYGCFFIILPANNITLPTNNIGTVLLMTMNICIVSHRMSSASSYDIHTLNKAADKQFIYLLPYAKVISSRYIYTQSNHVTSI